MLDLLLKEIRLHLGRVRRSANALQAIQDRLPLPPDDELEDMIAGKIPPSEGAYVAAVLQLVLMNLVDDMDAIREDLRKRAVSNPSTRMYWHMQGHPVRELLKGVKVHRQHRRERDAEEMKQRNRPAYF